MLDLYLQLLRRELAERYRGAYLGVLWAFLTPLAMLLVFSFVFGVVFQARWHMDGQQADTLSFAQLLFIGLLLYGFLAECMTRSPSLIAQRVAYVKHVRFPLWILPLVTVGSALVQLLIGLALVLLVMLLNGRMPSSLIFLFPVFMLPLLAIACAMSWFLSATGVYVRDVQQLVVPLSQVLLFMSPVFYSLEMLPEQYKHWFVINPLAWGIDAARALLVIDVMPSWSSWAVWMLISTLSAALAIAWFQRAREGFADVL